MLDRETTEWLNKELKEKPTSIEKVMSADHNQVYRIKTREDLYFFKIGKELDNESERLVWLDGRLPVPKIIAYRQAENETDQLLTVGIQGDNLSHLVGKVPINTLVELLAQALQLIHSLDITDCPFGEKREGHVFSHGDATLPNFIFHNNKLQGIIDLGHAGIKDPTVDLAAAIWSLNHNCGKGYGVVLLEAYGISSPNEQYADKLANWYYQDYTDELHK